MLAYSNRYKVCALIIKYAGPLLSRVHTECVCSARAAALNALMLCDLVLQHKAGASWRAKTPEAATLCTVPVSTDWASVMYYYTTHMLTLSKSRSLAAVGYSITQRDCKLVFAFHLPQVKVCVQLTSCAFHRPWVVGEFGPICELGFAAIRVNH